MTRFLVTGASGLLGLNFALQFTGKHELVGVTHQHGLPGAPFRVITADLTEPGMVYRLLEEVQPDVIVNCAALALPDVCEREPALTERINARMPGELAMSARRRGIPLVHISTDAVFDGQRGGYSEADATNPLNTYARSKLAGEQAVASAYPDALIARVVFYGWSLGGARSLGEFFYSNLAAGRGVQGFTDAVFCPLQVNDLAAILMQMVDKGLTGAYHVFSAEPISKYDFGVLLARQFGLDETLIRPASINDGGLAARRSPNLAMRVEKLSAALGAPLPDQASGMRRLFAEWQAGWPERLRALAD